MKNDSGLADIVRNSPSLLLQELGLQKVVVYRPGQFLEKSGEVELCSLDDNIRNHGRAFIFRPAHRELAAIRVLDQHDSYQLLWLEHDYTRGKFSFGALKNEKLRPVLLSAAVLERFSLGHLCRRDIV